MIYRNIYPEMDDSRIILLKELLNELLEPSPNLAITDKYNNETKAALKRFEQEIGVITLGRNPKTNQLDPNITNRFSILPADGVIDDTTWIAIGMALKIRKPERFRQLILNDRELSDMFGLIPGTLEINKYPPFSSGDLQTVKEALEDAKKMVNKEIKKDNILVNYGVPNVSKLLEGVVLEGTDCNVFDGRKSYGLNWEKNGSKSTDLLTKTIKQYFIDNKLKVGAIVQSYGGRDGKNVMFIGDFFFNPSNNNFQSQIRAFIIMHESVHLIGNKKDEDFGRKGGTQSEGSKALSEKLVGAFFRILLAYKGKLGVV